MPVSIDYTDIISWSVSASMESGLSATIELANTHNKYASEDFLYSNVTLEMIIDGVSKTVFFGYIVGRDPTFEVSSKENIAFSCLSIFNRLGNRPINTELYDTVLMDGLLYDILSNYCGYDSTYYELNNGNPSFEFTNICINEPSTIEALQKLAQASGNELFVDLDGKLKLGTIAAGITGDSLISVSPHYIGDCKLIHTDEVAFSTVRVRGAYSSIVDGPAAFLWPFQYSNIQFNQYPRELVYATYYTNAPDECFENAVITSADPKFVSGYVSYVQNMNGLVRMEVQLEVTTAGAVQGSHNITILVTPADYQLVSTDALGLKVTNFSKGISRRESEIRAIFNHPQRTTGSTNFRSLKPPDEKEVNRYEAIVQDATLHAKIGTVWTEIDNVYIPSEAVCQTVAQQYIDNYKKTRKIWEVSVVPSTEYNLNYILQFTPQELTTEVYGLIREINISFTCANGELKQDLKLEELPQ